jgi:hypothetical protein
MLPSHKTRILIATQPVDFRKGHDGLVRCPQGHDLNTPPLERNCLPAFANGPLLPFGHVVC